ncbi:MAG: hypothetical protein V2A69_09140 [Pseudomonadota bacterium]
MMNSQKRWVWVATALLFLATILSGVSASADEKQEAMQLVEKARFALESFMADGKMKAFHGLLKKASKNSTPILLSSESNTLSNIKYFYPAKAIPYQKK